MWPGASSVFDSTTITEFVNQNLLFSFSCSLLTSDVARIFSLGAIYNLKRRSRVF